MRQRAAVGTSRRVVAYEEYAAEARIEARHHDEGILGPRAQYPGLPGQDGRIDRAAGTVGVLDQYILDAALDRGLAGGGHFVGHLGAEVRALGLAYLGLFPVRDPANALDIRAYIQLIQNAPPE
jgi:hypothetical protein